MENVRKSRKVEMVFHVGCLITGYMEFFPSIEDDIMENFPSRHEAFAAERKIKGWVRKKKEALIHGGWEAMQGISKKLKMKK